LIPRLERKKGAWENPKEEPFKVKKVKKPREETLEKWGKIHTPGFVKSPKPPGHKRIVKPYPNLRVYLPFFGEIPRV